MNERALHPSWTIVLFVLSQASTLGAQISIEQQETFLSSAKIVSTRTLSEGITRSSRGTLSDGQLTHDASIQSIDEFKMTKVTTMGTEINFKDTYKANIAAYRLGKILGIAHMIPPSVYRKVKGDSSAVTWWVDDVLMTEKERFFAKTKPPDPDNWNQQMYVVRVFDQLIYNTDRNLGNLVIDESWGLHMIDHTRAFRTHKQLRNESYLLRCDRQLFEALQALDAATLQEELDRYLTDNEIEAILNRRDRIVKIFKEKAEERGESAVFYDLRPASN